MSNRTMATGLAVSCRRFGEDARSIFTRLTHRFPVVLDYAVDSEGGELLGVLPGNDEQWNMLIAYPITGGFIAEDGESNLIGHFQTAEALCLGLSCHLQHLCGPVTLH